MAMLPVLRLSLLLATVSALSAPGPARAQVEGAGWLDEASDPRLRSRLLGYGMEWAVHGQDEVYVSPMFRIELAPIETLSFELQLGFVAAPAVRVGNPTLTVWYGDRLGSKNPERRAFDDVGGSPWARSSLRARQGTRYRFGLSLAAPLAMADDAAGAQALGGAALQRGMRSAWLWTPESFAAALPAEFSTRGEHFLGRLDLAVALLAPTNGVGDPVQFAWQAGLELAGAFARDAFSFGARVDVVHRPSDPLDAFQASVEPFLQLSLFDHFLRAGLRINLDEPGGPPFVPTLPGVPSWSLLLALGGALYR